MNAEEIIVAGTGNVYVAPTSATLPTDPSADLPAGFVELGYITTDGATLTATPNVEDIEAWQKRTPVRRLMTSRELSVSFAMQQWNADNFALAFGGGEWSEPDSGVYRFDPPADDEELTEYALVLDWADKGYDYRVVVYRGNVADTTETNLTATGSADLPITFSALSPDGKDRAWYFLTDDPAFTATTGS